MEAASVHAPVEDVLVGSVHIGRQGQVGQVLRGGFDHGTDHGEEDKDGRHDDLRQVGTQVTAVVVETLGEQRPKLAQLKVHSRDGGAARQPAVGSVHVDGHTGQVCS